MHLDGGWVHGHECPDNAVYKGTSAARGAAELKTILNQAKAAPLIPLSMQEHVEAASDELPPFSQALSHMCFA